jgi:hypothetical protein
MGITTRDYAALFEAIGAEGMAINGLRMLELGSQFMFLNPPSGVPYSTVAKGCFGSLGIQHTSVDTNNSFGALPLDLGAEIDRPAWVDYFDVVTDFGTMEHVHNQYWGFKNVHLFCRPGGLMVHSVPKVGYRHGKFWYTMESFEDIARVSSCSILRLEEHPSRSNTQTAWKIFCILRKEAGSTFPSEEGWERVKLYDKKRVSAYLTRR